MFLFLVKDASLSVDLICMFIFGHDMTSQIFDNEEFDCRTPEDWLALGCEEGSSDRKPVPAKAFLPTNDTKSAGTVCSQMATL